MSKLKIPEDYGNIAVLMGGCSAEREISLASGEAIYRSLKKQGFNVIKIDPAQELDSELKTNKVNRAFIALHGKDGEDGVIQAFLKKLNIPFTGCDIASSSIAMNKFFSKSIWQTMNIPTASFTTVKQGQVINLEQAKNYFKQLGKILFVKPVSEGSSLGISKVTNEKELITAIKDAHSYDEIVLIESFIDGDEYFVGVINEATLPSVKIKTSRSFYDYQAKYQSNDTEYFCPSGLSFQDEQLVSDLALKAFNVLGCSGWGRMDFIQSKENNQFYILEANTVPGMTESSLLPKAAKIKGITFDDLVIQILDTSLVNELKLSKELRHG